MKIIGARRTFLGGGAGRRPAESHCSLSIIAYHNVRYQSLGRGQDITIPDVV
jgi:hypothetical protein